VRRRWLLTLTTVSVAVADGHHSQTPSASCPATQGVIGTVSALSASGFTLTTANGTKLSVGVILPATLTFNTGAPEIMECVGGFCEYKLDGSEVWLKSSAGEKFSVPGNSKFDIRVSEPYHYICHFG